MPIVNEASALVYWQRAHTEFLGFRVRSSGATDCTHLILMLNTPTCWTHLTRGLDKYQTIPKPLEVCGMNIRKQALARSGSCYSVTVDRYSHYWPLHALSAANQSMVLLLLAAIVHSKRPLFIFQRTFHKVQMTGKTFLN